jgi:hypothetical protein
LVENGAYRRLRIGGDDAEIVLGRPVLSGSVPFPIARGAHVALPASAQRTVS